MFRVFVESFVNVEGVPVVQVVLAKLKIVLVVVSVSGEITKNDGPNG